MIIGQRSKENVEGVHPDLVRLMETVVTPYPIIITEGLRTVERQRELVEKGSSQTMNSRHLSGHAIDFAVVDDGKVTWDFPKYREVAKAIKDKAKALGIPVAWGGDWAGFKDGTHIQLTWEAYPISPNQKTASNSKTVGAAIFGIPVAAFIPEIFATIGEMTGHLTSFDGEIAKWVQMGAVLLVAGFVIWERVSRIEKDGT